MKLVEEVSWLDTVTVRTYTPEDRGEVARLYRDGLLEGVLGEPRVPPDLLYVESFYFGEPQAHLWVAERDDRVIGMVGVVQGEPGVGLVRRLRAVPDERPVILAVKLLHAALAFAWQQGCLKVVLDTHLDPELSKHLVASYGFQFTRQRTRQGRPTLEFFSDLYHEPQALG